MGVDESWRDYPISDVQCATGFRLGQVADGYYLTILDADIGSEPGVARAIDDPSVCHDHVQHRFSLSQTKNGLPVMNPISSEAR
jgi:hypothetical protein